ncbi:methyltransferase [Streptomyces albipurpureus]|uniref:Methyltransferase n=1 Tax=Streptomyces albipurpureus TaxID=2897419 RepID=A0ABT0UFP9_9ACTN|nr:methyltransferase [Streptomyces sp. CWNU-1]MCM2387224.1 methyltransferase [Streptomyces sp. CWNU-1]
MTAPPWSQELLRKSDLITPMAIRVAATLRLSDHMAAGAVTPDALARAAAAEPGALRRLLGHLVGAGIYRSTQEGTYEPTALGEMLRGDVPNSGRDWLELDGPIGRGELAFLRLLDAVRTGRSVYSSVYGQEFWQDVEADPAMAESFGRRMAANMASVVPELLARADWHDVGHVLDIGGGDGTLLTALAHSRPDLSGTLIDLAAPAAAARQEFAAAGLGDRCSAVAGSFFDPLPPGADVHLLSNVLLNWDDDRATALLRRCAEAIAPGGRVLVLEGLLDVQLDQTELDLRMLVYLDGRMRTSDDLRALGEAAGLTLRRVTDLGPLRSLAELVPSS